MKTILQTHIIKVEERNNWLHPELTHMLKNLLNKNNIGITSIFKILEAGDVAVRRTQTIIRIKIGNLDN